MGVKSIVIYEDRHFPSFGSLRPPDPPKIKGAGEDPDPLDLKLRTYLSYTNNRGGGAID